jgi:hypothetical protein
MALPAALMLPATFDLSEMVGELISVVGTATAQHRALETQSAAG